VLALQLLELALQQLVLALQQLVLALQQLVLALQQLELALQLLELALHRLKPFRQHPEHMCEYSTLVPAPYCKSASSLLNKIQTEEQDPNCTAYLSLSHSSSRPGYNHSEELTFP
jgi:hypothetical protein